MRAMLASGCVAARWFVDFAGVNDRRCAGGFVRVRGSLGAVVTILHKGVRSVKPTTGSDEVILFR